MAEIWSYIAEESSETVATRFLGKLHTTCVQLLAYPAAHPEREQLGPGLRVAFHGIYAVYYRHDLNSVTVVRVLHGARDLAAIASQGGFDL